MIRPSDFIQKNMFESFIDFDYGFSQCMVDALKYSLEKDVMGLAEFIEVIIPCTKPTTFILTKNYTLVETLEHSFGKWPDQFGNGFFIEGEYLFDDFVQMFRDKVEQHS